jgi:hypothetical protein
LKSNINFWSYLAQFFLELEIFQTKVVETIKTLFMFSNSFPENYAIYEIMCKNIVESGRPQMTIWHVRFACWMPKATNIHSGYVIFTPFPRQQWLYECTLMLGYTYIACLVLHSFVSFSVTSTWCGLWVWLCKTEILIAVLKVLVFGMLLCTVWLIVTSTSDKARNAGN